MQSSPKDPPRLIIVKHEDGILQGFVTADTVNIECSSADVFDIMINIQAAYYAWDLSFPTKYQLFAFFQVYILQDEKDSVFKGSAFIKLVKALKL